MRWHGCYLWRGIKDDSKVFGLSVWKSVCVCARAHAHVSQAHSAARETCEKEKAGRPETLGLEQ